MTYEEEAIQAHRFLTETDPEVFATMTNFAFKEVDGEIDIPRRSKDLSTIGYLLGCQATDEYRLMLPVFLAHGLTAIEVKEVLYQALDYLGMARVMPFFKITNEILQNRSESLPLPGQATTNEQTRLSKGEETQIRLFGPQMKDFSKKGTINRWLTANCFGDYYTRTGLSDQDRELITFCYLAAQGGVEPQLLAHAKANIRVGNDEAFLTKIVLQNVPYIGYPRSLNALKVIQEAANN
ncbi:carboxymuconolactone decarboxylase family protein [Lactobacillus gigeriorum]|uniref:Carboxymuconolactone decarboxylase n=1 Tax=Lactobacillus gigeriorum DSM 23908 = CRBIP 24.85 TaxID=1423751 RepID=I7KP22_9LACO|nr:carboxymuconolactone decarboxylase family protein [Lactobacillus gigeriorum]KRN09294.1 carboxymuconolactone decarboxylase [Lactobacillus gigeriorum DSM 23908 = CRBIP 24.85]CCI87069.1 Carboxymuconolactone decarboxylase [Lactobacillus gigeriorum DSM 23908 = CRBIP 24.85]